MQWITRSHIHVDRVACPWLITRFIDNEAEFLFVPANQIEKVVKEISSAREFQLTEDEKMCRFCIYRSYCNRGAQAGQIDEAEAEMESEAAFDVNFEQIGEIEF